ncbi:hypothetical protein OIU78_010549 [Salix suchowensis]|nr:hypothetical protein OIU78_010549 [Salix suchowensis]
MKRALTIQKLITTTQLQEQAPGNNKWHIWSHEMRYLTDSASGALLIINTLDGKA